jgi:hypothetical protein
MRRGALGFIRGRDELDVIRVRLLLALLAALLGSLVVSSVVHADACTYDVSQLARVEFHVPGSNGSHRVGGASATQPESSSGAAERTIPLVATFVATNTVNGARLNARLTAEEIAGGHSYEKNVVSQGEFPGIRTRGQFADMIENVINNYDEMKCLSGGRIAYWRDGVVVIRNPSAVDGGTAFVPRDGYTYFEGL